MKEPSRGRSRNISARLKSEIFKETMVLLLQIKCERCLFIVHIMGLLKVSFQAGMMTLDVSLCPMNNTMWLERANNLNCTGKTEYHCAIAESRENRIEICLEKSSIAPGNCPKILPSGYLDWWRCNVTNPECPKDYYLTTEVHKYPLCYGELKKSEGSKSTVRDKENNGKTGDNTGVIVGVIIAVIIIIIIVLVIVYRRREIKSYFGKKGSGSDNLEDVPLKDKDGIIRTKFIDDGLKYIDKYNYLLVIGKLGSSVSKTGKSITSEYTERNPGWIHLHFNYKDIPIQFPKNSIVFVDGWFGLWNDDPGKLENVQTGLQTLISKTKATQMKCKVVIGMRSDIRDHYIKDLKDICPDLFNRHVINLDSVHGTKEEEIKAHFNDMFKLHACQVKGCACSKLTLERILDKDHSIGIFLKIDVLSKMHSLISEFLKTSDLKLTLTDHILDLENTDKELYECLMYVVLKGKYDTDIDIDTELIRNTNMSISKSTFEGRMTSLLKYYMKVLPPDRLVNITPVGDIATGEQSSAVVFWHVFLYICAFHAIYNKHSEVLLKHCNLDAIMQLARASDNSSSFTVKVTADLLKHLKERIKVENKEDEYMDHPLLK